jgi:hypothetical protein
MKTKLITFLLAITSFTAFATPPQFYWGMAQTRKAEGGLSGTLVLGKRWTDAGIEYDEQTYFSPEGSVTVSYEFHSKTGKMIVKSKGEKTGEGTFSCDKSKKTKCTFDYTITGKEGYRCKGNDSMGENGLYYSERADVLYPSNKNEKWSVDFYSISPEDFTAIQNKLK